MPDLNTRNDILSDFVDATISINKARLGDRACRAWEFLTKQKLSRKHRLYALSKTELIEEVRQAVEDSFKELESALWQPLAREHQKGD